MDIKLFSELALWFGKNQKLTVSQFLIWLVDYLPSADRYKLTKLVPFFMDEQANAEKTLCSLLENDFRKKKFNRRVSSSISRRTDWSRTYRKSLTEIPIAFHETNIETTLDRSLLGALSAIASEWKSWLEQISESKVSRAWKEKLIERAKNLENAICSVQKRGITICSSYLSATQRGKILQHVSNKEKDVFLKCLNRWNQYSVHDLKPIIKIIRDLLTEMLNENDELNKNDLFEATCHLSILKAAFDNNDGWSLIQIENSKSNNSTSKIKSYLLHNGKLYFKFGKGRPELLFPNSPLAQSGNNDRMLQLRQLAGLGGTGYEPDVVMGFYRNESEDPIVVFGDAKRYKKSNISGAYKDTVASTMIAYGHWGQLEITPSSGVQAFFSPVSPFFTIFYTPNEEKGNTVNTLSEQLKKKSPIAIIPLEKMLQNAQGSEEMKSWFKELSNRMKNVLPLNN